MKTTIQRLAFGAFTTVSALCLSNCAHEPVTQANAANASASQISRDSRAALNSLYSKDANARRLGRNAAGVLVFPKILKGGFIVGVEGGNGALIQGGNVTRYYQTAGASYGLQAGAQEFGYALFFMNRSELAKLDQAGGWDVGSSPSVVVLDRGKATEMSTATGGKSYAYFFDQKGLMAGLGLKGSKITRIHPGH
ncbi:lipid-binding SYLF domain-containing protein [Luteolibacter arcticus]|uniref:Lipid-binding SYLF domain-containing protein n=1 Tax=Luteolibacter arcticus TaxID=1581411 RepID=A0ABT3GHB5_9BACT|nr:lipid-binding SYLF domain-containing protein [Luteolibacter arcticus]MCW1923007.1 lipid-binding SYLF domain-containing protein [Luteolibacter arcticus]